MKNFNFIVSTVNGSGSQSSNKILVKTLFRMGLPVAGKNIFPSNIAGLPTWFHIRVNEKGYLSFQDQADLLVEMNTSSFLKNREKLKKGGTLIYNSNLKLDPHLMREDTQNIGIPFKSLAREISPSVKLTKYLVNMIYVGVLSELLDLDTKILNKTLEDFFNNKSSVIELNKKAISTGAQYVKDNLQEIDALKAALLMNTQDHQNSLLIDGNTSAGLGAVMGGGTFLAWYPITPSSSLAESFENYCHKHRVDKDGKKLFSIVQAEDELSAITMTLGAGWSGARSMTATSGPGLSLMAETAGLSYYAEVPTVIWDIQRVGPSTGLPTRTMQGDLLSAYNLSHGDGQHIVLLPSSPEECFHMAQTAFDLAERVQTLVIVLSDLDIGMNDWLCHDFEYPTHNFDRGKVVDKKQLEEGFAFARYSDPDKDGIPYRTLPGTEHPDAAFFSRGTGHDEKALYTEDGHVYQQNMDRLKRKFETARSLVPQPSIQSDSKNSIALLYFGSTEAVIPELKNTLKENLQLDVNTYCLKALPFTADLEKFVKQNKKVIVIEQNRDQQLYHLILSEFPHLSKHLASTTHYSGLPINLESILPSIKQHIEEVSHG